MAQGHGRKVDVKTILKLAEGFDSLADFRGTVTAKYGVTNRIVEQYVAALRSAGYIETPVSPAKKSAKLIRLTEQGQEALTPTGFQRGLGHGLDDVLENHRKRKGSEMDDRFAKARAYGVFHHHSNPAVLPRFEGQAREKWEAGQLGYCPDCKRKGRSGIKIERRLGLRPWCSSHPDSIMVYDEWLYEVTPEKPSKRSARETVEASNGIGRLNLLVAERIQRQHDRLAEARDRKPPILLEGYIPDGRPVVKRGKFVRLVDPFDGCETQDGSVVCPHCDLNPGGFPRSYVEEKQKWVCCQTPLMPAAAEIVDLVADIEKILGRVPA